MQGFLKRVFISGFLLLIIGMPMIYFYFLGEFIIDYRNDDKLIIGKMNETSSVKMRYDNLVKSKNISIVIAGSSRVLQFRKEFFKESFLNFGLNINSTRALIELSSILKEKKIKIDDLILNIDPWWFQELNNDQLKKHIRKPSEEHLISLFDCYKILVKQGIKYNFSQDTNYKLLGFNANMNLFGYRMDGSQCYGIHYYDKNNFPDSNTYLLDKKVQSKRFIRGKIGKYYLDEYIIAITSLRKLVKRLYVMSLPLNKYYCNSHYFNEFKDNIIRINNKYKIETIFYYDNNNSNYIDDFHINCRTSYNCIYKLLPQKMNDLTFIDEHFIKYVDDKIYNLILNRDLYKNKLGFD
jgi:hypothetical protein